MLKNTLKKSLKILFFPVNFILYLPAVKSVISVFIYISVIDIHLPLNLTSLYIEKKYPEVFL